MVYPNALAANFCFWMLNVSEQKLTGPQKVIVQSIYNAAVAAQSVSAQTWRNYNLFTAWRFKFYDEWQNQQPSKPLAATNIYLINWLAANFTAGNPSPSLNMLNRLNTALDFGQINNCISALDYLFLLNLEDINQCLVPLIDNVGLSPSFAGSPSFNPFLGLSGDLSNYLRTSYIEVSKSINFTASNPFVSICASTTSLNGGSAFGCSNSADSHTSTCYPCLSNNSPTFYVASAVGGSVPVSCSNVSAIYSRDASNNFNIYLGSSLVKSGSNSPQPLQPFEHFICCQNKGGTPYNYFDGFVSLVAVGNSSIDPIKFSIFQSLLTIVN